jgi:hypothetical protein
VSAKTKFIRDLLFRVHVDGVGSRPATIGVPSRVNSPPRRACWYSCGATAGANFAHADGR